MLTYNTYDPTNSIPRYLLITNAHPCSPIVVYMNIHRNTIHNSQKVEITQVSVDRINYGIFKQWNAICNGINKLLL